MPEMQLLPTATALYGEYLSGANRSELVAILSAAALELECRHVTPNTVSRTMETIHQLTNDASDDDILTLAIAAAIRLRLPNLKAVDRLMPAALTIAA
jgi:hypothetical protein